MARRFYLSQIIGDGTELNPYRADVADLGKPYAAIIPSNPDGTPKFQRALVIVNALDHTPILNRPLRNLDLPDLTMDATLGTLGTLKRKLILDKLAELGWGTSGIDSNTPFRTLLRRIGQRLVADFDENRFDVKGED